jgi:hypothetical protein
MSQLTLYERLRFRFHAHVVDSLSPRLVEPYRLWRNSSREYRPIFVAGAMGSGTSLLAIALGQRFEVAGVLYESARQISRGSFLYEPHMDEYASIAEYERGIRSKESWIAEGGRRDLTSLYRRHASGPGDWVVDKGPNTNLLRAGFLATCFPDAAWVVIHRDPVASVEGFRRKWNTFGRESVEANARFWVSAYEHCLRELDALDRRVLVVEYGGLAANSDDVLDELGRQIGLASASRRTRLRSRVNVEGWGIRNVARNEIGVVQNADQRSIARVPADDAAKIRAICDPLAAELGERTLRPSR